jgi:hypothetical protein
MILRVYISHSNQGKATYASIDNNTCLVLIIGRLDTPITVTAGLLLSEK